MFGKIKNRLKDVFSKTDEIIEEDVNSEVEETLNQENKDEISNDLDTQEESSTKDIEKEEALEQLEEETKELDELETEVEQELDDVEHDVEELEHIEEEKLEKSSEEEVKEELEKELLEEEKEQKEIDKLDEQLEEEIKEVEEDVEKLEHVEEENIEEENTDEKEPEKKKGFFSKMFSKKEETISEEENVEVEEKEILQTEEIKEESIVEKAEEKQVEEEITSEESSETEIKNEEKQEEKSGFLQSAFSGITHKKMSDNDFSTLWAELELFLLEINIAYEIVEKIERRLKTEIVNNKFSRLSLRDKTKEVLVSEVESVLKSREGDFDKVIEEFSQEKKPVVIMMLGVNGTGKTTTIGKVIHHFQKQKKSVVVAAADTFRAAAVEQVKEHCEKLGVKCVAHKQGADPASVAYDAIEHAKAKNLDVVLVDTAGRMPNNSNLMEELKKIKRVSGADEILFIGDSIAGNDLIDQIELFNKGLGITGVILTKVDTDERPGSVVTTAYAINTPIYFLGCGQTYDDLVKFDSKHIAEQLFNEE